MDEEGGTGEEEAATTIARDGSCPHRIHGVKFSLSSPVQTALGGVRTGFWLEGLKPDSLVINVRASPGAFNGEGTCLQLEGLATSGLGKSPNPEKRVGNE